ncbi:hypothetical protein D3C78_1279890 [compost metagenome]
MGKFCSCLPHYVRQSFRSAAQFIADLTCYARPGSLTIGSSRSLRSLGTSVSCASGRPLAKRWAVLFFCSCGQGSPKVSSPSGFPPATYVFPSRFCPCRRLFLLRFVATGPASKPLAAPPFSATLIRCGQVAEACLSFPFFLRPRGSSSLQPLRSAGLLCLTRRLKDALKRAL